MHLSLKYIIVRNRSEVVTLWNYNRNLLADFPQKSLTLYYIIGHILLYEVKIYEMHEFVTA